MYISIVFRYSIRCLIIRNANQIERGRNLHGYFLAAALNAVHIHPSQSVITDFATADRLYSLRETVQRAVSDGRISGVQGHHWISDLMSESAQGKFSVVFGAYTVIGERIPVT